MTKPRKCPSCGGREYAGVGDELFMSIPCRTCMGTGIVGGSRAADRAVRAMREQIAALQGQIAVLEDHISVLEPRPYREYAYSADINAGQAECGK